MTSAMMTRVLTVVAISLLVVVFSVEVCCFPAIPRDGEDAFLGGNGEELTPERRQTTYGEKRTIKEPHWNTDKDLPWSLMTHDAGEKRAAINNNHERRGLDKGFPPFPERPPWQWTTHGEKRSAINYKNEWKEKPFPFPFRPPWSAHEGERSAINYKNEWKGEPAGPGIHKQDDGKPEMRLRLWENRFDMRFEKPFPFPFRPPWSAHEEK